MVILECIYNLRLALQILIFRSFYLLSEYLTRCIHLHTLVTYYVHSYKYTPAHIHIQYIGTYMQRSYITYGGSLWLTPTIPMSYVSMAGNLFIYIYCKFSIRNALTEALNVSYSLGVVFSSTVLLSL